MHDTSTESLSKWRAVGSKRSDSMILSSGTTQTVRKQSRQYRPSKQREISNSKIFSKNKSRIQSLDNINKDDLNDSRSKIFDSRSKEVINLKEKKDSAIEQSKKQPIVRVNSITSTYDSKQQVPGAKTSRANKNNNYFTQRELITLKNDYTKFKQKILTQLEIQKHNITKFVNQILDSVKSQLLIIQEKYATNSSSMKREQSMPIFSNFNSILSSKNIKQHDISMIKNISPSPMSRNPTQKMLIAELTSKQILQDPITEHFSNFYSAIEKMKSQLNDMHQLSTNNLNESPPSLKSPVIANSTGISNGISRFLKT